MKIESKDFKIKSVFSRKKYIIPDYQRNYSWTIDEEISVFWDDFMYYLDKYEKANFFIGPMVFKGEDTGASEFEVIDGQQRLITFSILISVLVSLFLEYGEKELSEGLKQYLIYRDEKNNEKLVITTIEPHPFFQQKIFHFKGDAEPTRPSEKRINDARIFFEDKIKEYLLKDKQKKEKVVSLERIRDYIFNIDTVIIVSNDETDAFTIFETINSRGKDLLSIDLLKNYIFKNIPVFTGVEEPKLTWKKVTENIKIDTETFFNRFWASWVAKITENKLYRRFSDYMRGLNKNSVFKTPNDLLEKVSRASIVYKKITSPQIDDWKVNKRFHVYYHIKNINGLFALKVHFPFFLALFEENELKNISNELFDKTLILMEDFHFIFTHIVSPRASGLDNKYSKFAIRLRTESDKGKVIEDLKSELAGKIPSFEEYKEKFINLNFKDNKDTIKFLLLRIEKEKNPSNNIEFDSHSIDHLHPKSDSSLSNTNDLGNLFLLEQKYNEDKDSLKPFENWVGEDVSTLEYLINHTKYKTTKTEFEAILGNKVWDKFAIQKRTMAIAKESYRLFTKNLK